MCDNFYNRVKNYVMSFYIPIVVAIPITPFVGWFEKYVFGDWEFLKFLVVLMIVDTLMGFLHHIKKKDFSVEGFEKILIKVICYGCALIVAHDLSSYKILGASIGGFEWFRVTICTALIVREALSILNNIQKVYPNVLPPRIRKYLKYYDETGEIKKNL